MPSNLSPTPNPNSQKALQHVTTHIIPPLFNLKHTELSFSLGPQFNPTQVGLAGSGLDCLRDLSWWSLLTWSFCIVDIYLSSAAVLVNAVLCLFQDFFTTLNIFFYHAYYWFPFILLHLYTVHTHNISTWWYGQNDEPVKKPTALFNHQLRCLSKADITNNNFIQSHPM